MESAIATRPGVGRPKKQDKVDLWSIKVATDVYRNIKLIASFQGRDIAEVATELLRGPSEKLLKAEKLKDDARLSGGQAK